LLEDNQCVEALRLTAFLKAPAAEVPVLLFAASVVDQLSNVPHVRDGGGLNVTDVVEVLDSLPGYIDARHGASKGLFAGIEVACRTLEAAAVGVVAIDDETTPEGYMLDENDCATFIRQRAANEPDPAAADVLRFAASVLDRFADVQAVKNYGLVAEDVADVLRSLPSYIRVQGPGRKLTLEQPAPAAPPKRRPSPR
jgi:hypothetical protein